MTERVFLGWDEPLLPLAARFLASRYQRGDALDLKEVVLVMPGGRAGRRLKELLLAEARSRGCRLVPPRVVRAGQLAELFYTPPRPPVDAFLLRRVWSAVLQDNSRSLEGVFGALPGEKDLRGWNLLAEKVAMLQRETTAGGYLFDEVARICSSADLLFNDAERWSILAELQAEYRSRLSARDFGDADLNRIEALAAGAFATEQQVWLIGIAELPPVVSRIIEAVTGPVGALVHAPASESASFDAIGLVRAAAWQGRDLEVSDESLRVADRPGDQAAAILEELAGLGDVATAEVVVGLADEHLVPYLREWLEAAGLPTHYAGGTPIAASGPFRLLESVATYLERGEWEQFASLLRHPDLENWLDRRRRPDRWKAAADQLDKLFEEHLTARVRAAGPPKLFPTRIEEIGDLLEDGALLGRFGAGPARPLSEWATKVVEFLVEVYTAKSYVPQSRSDGRELRVLQAIRSAALQLHRLPPDLAPQCRAADAIRLLLDEIRAAAVPDEPEGAPVELLGWLDLAMDDAPHALVTGFNEGFVPSSLNADAFLPDRLRTRLGLPNNESRYARDAFHLVSLLKSRRTVKLISGRLSGAGDPLRPSRLLLSGTGHALARRVLAFTASEERATPREAPIAALAGISSQFQLPPARTLSFDPPKRLRVTDFRPILEDPYRFVLDRIYQLRSSDDDARELDGLGFGILAHTVLERFGSSAESASPDGDVIYRRISGILDEEAERRFGSNTFPAVHLQVEHLRLRLRRFAEWQAERTRGGWRIILVEGSAPGDQEDETQGARTVAEAPFDVDGETIQLVGRIDRIDHHRESGRWALLDYKTGDKVDLPDRTHRKRSGEWRDLQLPLYRHLAAGISDRAGDLVIPPGSPIELGYIALPRDLGRVGGLMAAWSPDDLEKADETAREVVRMVRQGTVTFDRSRVSMWEGDPFVSLFGLRLLLTAELEDGVAGVEA